MLIAAAGTHAMPYYIQYVGHKQATPSAIVIHTGCCSRYLPLHASTHIHINAQRCKPRSWQECACTVKEDAKLCVVEWSKITAMVADADGTYKRLQGCTYN